MEGWRFFLKIIFVLSLARRGKTRIESGLGLPARWTQNGSGVCGDRTSARSLWPIGSFVTSRPGHGSTTKALADSLGLRGEYLRLILVIVRGGGVKKRNKRGERWWWRCCVCLTPPPIFIPPSPFLYCFVVTASERSVIWDRATYTAAKTRWNICPPDTLRLMVWHLLVSSHIDDVKSSE